MLRAFFPWFIRQPHAQCCSAGQGRDSKGRRWRGSQGWSCRKGFSAGRGSGGRWRGWGGWRSRRQRWRPGRRRLWTFQLQGQACIQWNFTFGKYFHKFWKCKNQVNCSRRLPWVVKTLTDIELLMENCHRFLFIQKFQLMISFRKLAVVVWSPVFVVVILILIVCTLECCAEIQLRIFLHLILAGLIVLIVDLMRNIIKAKNIGEILSKLSQYFYLKASVFLYSGFGGRPKQLLNRYHLPSLTLFIVRTRKKSLFPSL